MPNKKVAAASKASKKRAKAAPAKSAAKKKAAAPRAKSAAPPVNILVSVSNNNREQLESVASRLRSAGMAVADVFPISGTIAGEAASDDLGKLRDVEGVSAVEEEPIFRAY